MATWDTLHGCSFTAKSLFRLLCSDLCSVHRCRTDQLAQNQCAGGDVVYGVALGLTLIVDFSPEASSVLSLDSQFRNKGMLGFAGFWASGSGSGSKGGELSLLHEKGLHFQNAVLLCVAVNHINEPTFTISLRAIFQGHLMQYSIMNNISFD